MPKPANAKPPDPPITEAEKDRASILFTAACDDMVARGYARHLWGNIHGDAQQFIILILREAAKPTINPI